MIFSKFKLSFLVFALLLGVIITTAYAADTRGIRYVSNDAMRMQSVLIGTVEDMRYVEIDESEPWTQPTGAALGATLGGLAGDQFGKGKGKTAMTIVMASLGAGIGSEVENIMNTAKGIEFIVSLGDGRTIAVVQAVDEESLTIRPGDRVRIVEGRNARVTKMRASSGYTDAKQSVQQTDRDQGLQMKALQQELEKLKLEQQQLQIEAEKIKLQKLKGMMKEE